MITEKTDVLIIASDTTVLFILYAHKGKTKASETQTNSPKSLNISYWSFIISSSKKFHFKPPESLFWLQFSDNTHVLFCLPHLPHNVRLIHTLIPHFPDPSELIF